MHLVRLSAVLLGVGLLALPAAAQDSDGVPDLSTTPASDIPEVETDGDVSETDDGTPTVGTAGKLVKIEGQTITYEAATSDKNLTKLVSPEAQITLNAKEAKLSDLQKGDTVRVQMLTADPRIVVVLRAARLSTTKPAQTLPKNPNRPPEVIANDDDRGPKMAAPNAGAAPTGLGLGIAISDAPNEGVLIGAVNPQSPAAKAGLVPGDYLMGLDGNAVTTPRDYMSTMGAAQPEQQVVVNIWRNGQAASIPVVLEQSKAAVDRVASDPTLDNLAERYGVDPNDYQDLDDDYEYDPNAQSYNEYDYSHPRRTGFGPFPSERAARVAAVRAKYDRLHALNMARIRNLAAASRPNPVSTTYTPPAYVTPGIGYGVGVYPAFGFPGVRPIPGIGNYGFRFGVGIGNGGYNVSGGVTPASSLGGTGNGGVTPAAN